VKQVTIQKIIANGGQKTTALALYLLDQQEIFQKWFSDPDNELKEWRNPTVAEIEKWNIDRRLIYNAAILAGLEIRKGAIIIAPKKGLL